MKSDSFLHILVLITPIDRRKYLTEIGNLRIPLARGASISGVYSINGRPKNDVLLWMYGGDRSYGQVRTDEQGHFGWGDLPARIYIIGGPSFRYRLELKKAQQKFIDLGFPI